MLSTEVITERIPIRMVLSIDEKGGIADNKDNIPWHHSDKKDIQEAKKLDLELFSFLTRDTHCILGKETFKTLPSSMVDDLSPQRKGREYHVMSKVEDEFSLSEIHPRIIRDDSPVHVIGSHNVLETINYVVSSYPQKQGISIIGGRKVYQEVLTHPDKYQGVEVFLGQFNDNFYCDKNLDLDVNDTGLDQETLVENGRLVELIGGKYMMVKYTIGS